MATPAAQEAASALLATQPPVLVELASAASLAVRIEPELLRSLRLALVRRADAGAEARLWFGPLIEARGADGIVLRADLVEPLRQRLAHREGRMAAAWQIIERVHRTISPAIQLEERIAWLALSGGAAAAAAIERELQRALSALVRERRSGIARWALRALPRMPKAARTTTAAWLLALRAAREVGQSPRLDADPPPDLMKADLRELLPEVGHVELGVRRMGGKVIIGDVYGHDVKGIRVPDTEPRFLEVTVSASTRPPPQVVAVPAGATVEVDAEPRAGVSLVTADRLLYQIEPLPRPIIQIVTAPADREVADRLWKMLLAEDPRGEIEIDTLEEQRPVTIRKRDLTLVLISPQAMGSRWFLAHVSELRQTAPAGPLIPILVRPTPLIDKALVGLQRLPRDGGALGSPPDLEQLRMLVHEVTRIVDDLQRGGPRTLVVASDGTAPYRQIASANGIARPGDTILLKPGVYKEPENIALGPGVSLVGENAATVIVDGGGRGWVLRAADNCEIAHLTIRGSGAATGVNDCGVMIDGCKGVRVHHNVVSKNRHYGIIVRNAEASIHDNVIADNRILGIYADEGAVLDVVRNVFHRHRHSALDIQARNARGRFHRNTVVACGNGLLYGSSLDRPLDVEVFDNIFMDQESGVSAPGIWSSRVDHNLFFRVENAYYDSERSRAVELDGSNRQADPRLVPGSFALAADSPAIGAARDGGDLGAFPFDEHAARRPPPAKADEHPQARRRVKRTGAKGGVKKRKAKSQVEKPPAKQSSSGARRATSSNRKRQRSTRKERRSSRKK